ncbi:uncharacterized protein LOC115632086 [Scaptodrosophila lebanonensis]|uniref:Uncharacterized protein LOC115632086 n=1 Tax=Drosophila lebanonensis TaxID=7225 RepID=A0A6J2UA79_DROLE|nr:uncharacterized protein LOC115632086 [Scaptodrosophila lebanonensis]
MSHLPQILLGFCSIILFNIVIGAVPDHGVNGKPLAKAATFHFAEYAYKETSKNEIIYHDFELACEQHPLCLNIVGVPKVNCIRQCISPSCFQDIYAFDELEEGEIDVRMNSFKGCVIQRAGSHR